ncbi:hypothetical protein ABE354_08640 [Brevibacillus laterosporus]|uniref:hypothetical protein n=1 Tax=Brevibacillus laterosporus TaxID=1465 RepID=UPI003D1D73A2
MANEDAKFFVTGGTICFHALTLSLQKEKPFDYALGKAHVWLEMINNRQMPVKWYKPTKQGQNIRFQTISSNADNQKALDALDEYLKKIRDDFEYDIHLKKESVGV